MPIMRNPFNRRPGATPVIVTDENQHPNITPGFERVDTMGSKGSSVLSIRSAKSQDNGEYKMSVVNDSGVYLPPSPTEEKGQWPRKYLSSRTSTDTSVGDIEPFSISRESFDSYRRSFDISARSPILNPDTPQRQSLDSARFPRPLRADRNFERQPPTAEEGFEDVGLDDQKHQQQPPPRKRGFFSKFSDGQEKPEKSEKHSADQQGVSRFLTGRKRAQSGQGAELGAMDHVKLNPEGQEMQ